MTITWNDKGLRLIPATERELYELGVDDSRKLEGTLRTDPIGNVWYRSGEHHKLVGTSDLGTPAKAAPKAKASATAKPEAISDTARGLATGEAPAKAKKKASKPRKRK